MGNTGRPCRHLAGHRSVKTTGTKPTKETIRTAEPIETTRTMETFLQQIFRKKGRKLIAINGTTPCPGLLI